MTSEVSISLLIPSLSAGGAERQITALARGLSKRGHNVDVGVFGRGGVLESEIGTARLVDLSGNPLTRYCRIGKYLRQRRPQVLYSFLVTPNVMAALSRPSRYGTRLVWGVRASNVDLSVYGPASRMVYGLERKLSGRPDIIVANSLAGMTHSVSLGFPAENMTVIPNGVDTERFRPYQEAGEALRREWGVGKNEILIGRVGRLDPMKDYPCFIRAAEIMAAGRDDLRFVCVGSGPDDYTDELKELSAGLGSRMIWTGAVSDMPGAFNAMDLNCSSSAFGEGFSNALSEAMACGTPCAGTDTGDTAMLLGDTGEISPVRNPEELASSMERLLKRWQNGGEAMCKAARNRIVENFSLDRMVEKTESVLLGLVNG